MVTFSGLRAGPDMLSGSQGLKSGSLWIYLVLCSPAVELALKQEDKLLVTLPSFFLKQRNLSPWPPLLQAYSEYYLSTTDTQGWRALQSPCDECCWSLVSHFKAIGSPLAQDRSRNAVQEPRPGTGDPHQPTWCSLLWPSWYLCYKTMSPLLSPLFPQV